MARNLRLKHLNRASLFLVFFRWLLACNKKWQIGSFLSSADFQAQPLAEPFNGLPSQALPKVIPEYDDSTNNNNHYHTPSERQSFVPEG